MSWFFEEKSDQKFQPLELSITTLFIHAARLDDNYSEIEKKTIVQCLQKLGIADKNYIQELIRECEVLETNSNQILHLTQEIKKVSYPERLKIIEMLVEIIYADKKLDSFEDNLIRRVAGLIYIESADMGAIRINIKKKLNL
jgi:uncharacterized tellurite resistance protein B-like protein